MERYVMNPKTSHRDRLYVFWEAYDREAALLLRWHEDANERIARAPSDLYKSFLHTWGGGSFEPADLPLNQKGWFAALHVASVLVINKCLEVLKSENGQAMRDHRGEPLFATDKTEQHAKDMIDELKEIYKIEKTKLLELDQMTERLARVENDPDSYLHVLNRLCKIETNCFETQHYFLENGELEPGRVPNDLTT